MPQGVKVRVLSAAPIKKILMKKFSHYKGVRDFYPDDWRQVKYLLEAASKTADSYGYEAYEAPLLEPLEIYEVKAQNSQEIITNQVYRLTDEAGRRLAVRPEMTPSLARLVVARQTNLLYPLRWYSCPRLWRYEKPQYGRLREHYQFNADILGVDSWPAEYELIWLLTDIFKKLGALDDDYVIYVNSRPVLEKILLDLGIDQVNLKELIQLIDGRLKNPAFFKKKVGQILSSEQALALEKLLNIGDFKKLPEGLQKEASAKELGQLLTNLEKSGLKNVFLNLGIVRGFDYYTGIVFEVFDKKRDNSRSLAGGGRYDRLVESFGGQPLAAVGFGLGDVTLANFCQSRGLLPKLASRVEVLLALLPETELVEVWPLVNKLRAAGLKIEVEFSPRRLDKKINLAAKKGIPWVLFAGPKEVNEQVFVVKNLASGQQKSLSPSQLVELFLE